MVVVEDSEVVEVVGEEGDLEEDEGGEVDLIRDLQRGLCQWATSPMPAKRIWW